MGYVMLIFLSQVGNHSVMAGVNLAIVDELLSGALSGIPIGILVGAIVMPMMQAPDTMLRSVAFAILAAVGMSLFQLSLIGRATGERMGTILSAFTGPYTDQLGSMIFDGIIWALYAMLAGALIGMATQVPDKVIKGGIVGMFLGVAVGAGLQAVLSELGYDFGPIIFRILTAGVTWALFTALIGGED